MTSGTGRSPFASLAHAVTLHRAILSARWALIGWVVVFWRLGYPSLLDPDEAHYAQLTREMLRAGNWFVPLLDGVPLIDKPVFFHWMQALSVSVLGESELALRLPSALAALALFWTTWWLGTELFESKVADWGAMMIATIPATFMLSSLGLFDMIFAAFLFGALSCLLVAAVRERPHLQYAGWILLTLAVMTKGPVALLLIGAFFVSANLLGGDGRRVVQRLEWPAGLLFALFAASPWFVWMWGRFGDGFIREYMLAGNLWYMTMPAAFSLRSSSYAFYLRTFAGAFFPWSLVAIGCGLDALLARRRWHHEPLPVAERLLWIWIAVVVLFFTLAGFKLDTYIFPTAPACCLLAASGWRRAASHGRWSWTLVAVTTIAMVLMAGGVVASAALFGANLDLPWTAVCVPAAMLLGGAWLLRQIIVRNWHVPLTVRVPIATLLTVYGAIVVLGLPVLERSRPTAPLGRWIQRHSQPDTPVGVYGLFDWRSSIRYYTDRNVTTLGDGPGVDRFFKESPKGYVLMLRRDYERFRSEGLDIKTVQRRAAIAGRSGKYVRRQIWDELVIVTPASTQVVDGEP